MPPGAFGRLPPAGVHLHPAHEAPGRKPLTGVVEVDEAVVGELWHERLGDPGQRLVELQGGGEPVTDPVK